MIERFELFEVGFLNFVVVCKKRSESDWEKTYHKLHLSGIIITIFPKVLQHQTPRKDLTTVIYKTIEKRL